VDQETVVQAAENILCAIAHSRGRHSTCTYDLIFIGIFFFLPAQKLEINAGGVWQQIGTKLLRDYWTNRSSLHGSKHPGAVTSLGDDYVEAERDTWEFLLAGGELFTTEPSKLLQTLLFRPDCLQKVMEEVWLMSETPGGAPWRGSDVSNMKYLVCLLCNLVNKRAKMQGNTNITVTLECMH
jgi:hypothetical protein